MSKKPLLEYEKGETSKSTKNNHDSKIKYAYADVKNLIGMLESIEYLCIASPHDDNQHNYDVDDE